MTETVKVKPNEAFVTATHLALLEAVSRGWLNMEKLVKIENKVDLLHRGLLEGKRLVRLDNGIYAVEDKEAE